MDTITYDDILRGVKTIFQNQEECYDYAVNDDVILSVDWDKDLGEYRDYTWVRLIVNKKGVSFFFLGDYKDESEMTNDIFTMYKKNQRLEKCKEYINDRIKQEQEESGEWIDIVLNSETKEEAQKAYNEYLKKKCVYDR